MSKQIAVNCGGLKPTNGITELVFILDKSGSMGGMEDDTIGGFNAMIEKQKVIEGTVYISTVLFSNTSEVLHDRKELNQIQPLTKKDYQVGGCTALLDAVGRAIKHISNIHKYARKEDIPERTMFVITTDGQENASQEYSHNQIKDMIRKQEQNHGWEFLFLAANIDAASTAESIGISEDRAVNYVTEEDTVDMFEEVGKTIKEYRMRSVMPCHAGKRIEENIKNKKSKK